jgi:hypothetical protein
MRTFGDLLQFHRKKNEPKAAEPDGAQTNAAPEPNSQSAS